jgi:hypothetical protein
MSPPTWDDFLRRGWPAPALAALAAAAERACAPTPRRPAPPAFRCGVAPAAAYLALAGLTLAWRAWRP